MSDDGTATAAEDIDLREPRFRIAGDPIEALKVVLAQLPDED